MNSLRDRVVVVSGGRRWHRPRCQRFDFCQSWSIAGHNGSPSGNPCCPLKPAISRPTSSSAVRRTNRTREWLLLCNHTCATAQSFRNCVRTVRHPDGALPVSALGLDTDPVVHGGSDALLAAPKVALQIFDSGRLGVALFIRCGEAAF
jgi:hypothetical protein